MSEIFINSRAESAVGRGGGEDRDGGTVHFDVVGHPCRKEICEIYLTCCRCLLKRNYKQFEIDHSYQRDE